MTKELSNQEKKGLQGKTVIPVDYIPGGNNQTWRLKKNKEGYFTLQDNKTEEFLTAFNNSTMFNTGTINSTMDIFGRFLVIYRSFFCSFLSYLI